MFINNIILNSNKVVVRMYINEWMNQFEWTNKMWCMHVVYASIQQLKRSSLSIHATVWMNPKSMLSEKATHKMLHILWSHLCKISGKGDSVQKESISGVA